MKSERVDEADHQLFLHSIPNDITNSVFYNNAISLYVEKVNKTKALKSYAKDLKDFNENWRQEMLKLGYLFQEQIGGKYTFAHGVVGDLKIKTFDNKSAMYDFYRSCFPLND